MSNFVENSAADPVVIVAAQRTAIGSFNGVFANTPAHELGAIAIKAALQQSNVLPDDVDEVIFGQILTAAQGQNPARQAAMKAGLPQEKTAFVVNQLCGSGLRAVALGAQSILCGDADIIVAGGQESMSLAPHAIHLRGGVKFGDATMTDTMISDGLTDAFNHYHMGITAENIAAQYDVSRADQDAFAAQSQQRAEAAIAAGKFKAEITPVKVKVKKEELEIVADEFPRKGVTAEGLSALKPAFKSDGTVTAANASGLNDGAAALVLMRASEAKRRGLKPFAKIAAWATAGVDPAVMGTGPIPSVKKVLKQTGWSADDVDLFESNEAFAAQACCVLKELKLDPAKVNVNGGAIALGHPIGASGARVLVTLVHEMARRKAGKGIATLCIGGGMGVAMAVVRDETMEWNEVE